MKLDVRKLKLTIAEKGFNVRGLAMAANLSEPGLNMILNHGKQPRLDTLGKLSKALNVPPASLLKE